MRQTDKDFEKLSALLDNEVSNLEKEALKDKLADEEEYRNKYSELNRLKELVAEVKPLQPDPYFETKFNERLNHKSSFFTLLSFNKPIVAFSAVAILLMVILKFGAGPLDDILNSQKSNIKDFYTVNLQPIFAFNNLDKEAIFDFAFKQQLNLNNKQILTLGIGDNGSGYFEVKEAGLDARDKNFTLQSFVESLKLNNGQRKQVDSILESYSDRIASSVLVNDKKSVVVSPDLINYNLALRADLLGFAKKVNSEVVDKIVVTPNSSYTPENLAAFSKKANNTKSSKFVCLGKDTIFSVAVCFDRDSLKREIHKIRNGGYTNITKPQTVDLQFTAQRNDNFVHKGNVNLDPRKRNEIRIIADNNSCRIVIPDMPNDAAELDRMGNHLEEAMENFKNFSISVSESHMQSGGNVQSFGFNIRIDTAGKSQVFQFRSGPNGFGFTIPTEADWETKINKFADSLSNAMQKAGADSNLHQRRKFIDADKMRKLDSLTNMFKFFSIDSTGKSNNGDWVKQMEMFKKQMENFRKEMEDMRKDMVPQQNNSKRKKSMEI